MRSIWLVVILFLLLFQRSFYKNQDKLITTLERAHRLHSNKDSDNEGDNDEQEGETNNKNINEDPKLKRKRVSLYTKLSLLVNIVSVNRSWKSNVCLFRSVYS
jgi:hypothetical protein